MNELRNKIQQEASDKIIENRFIGILFMGPRVGKTKTVIDSLNRIDPSKQLEVLVIAPKLPILDSWKKEVKTWNLQKNINITYSWSNSIHKVKDKFFNLIIADEIHDYSDKVYASLRLHQMKNTRILGVTGTLSVDEETTIRKSLGLQKIFNYSFEQAVKDGIIADYNISCIGVELDNNDPYIEYTYTDKKTNQKVTKFITESEAYEIYNNRYEKCIQHGNFKSAKFYVSKRMNIIYNSKAKFEKSKELLSILERCLIFTARTEIADKLGNKSFHGKSNKKSLEQFINNEFNQLAVVSMISMGVTIPNLKTILFNQLKSSESLCVQQALRAMNLDDKNRTAQIVIIYAKGTQDEIWMMSAISSFDKSKIKFK